MADKKSCAACGKMIPEAALTCVFCRAKQEVAPIITPARGLPALDEDRGPNGAGTSDLSAALTPETEAPAKTRNTVFGMQVDQDTIAAARRAIEVPAAGPPRVAEPIATTKRPTATPAGLRLPALSEPQVRQVMALAGLLLLLLYASIYRVMVALVGLPLLLQHSSLVVGAVLVAASLLPLPERTRAAVGACASAVPTALILATLAGGGLGLLSYLGFPLLGLLLSLVAALLLLFQRPATAQNE